MRASRTSLCDTLQEREKKTGTGTSGTAALDHSALLLRAKQPGEKSDAHFVEVIREDRSVPQGCWSFFYLKSTPIGVK